MTATSRYWTRTLLAVLLALAALASASPAPALELGSPLDCMATGDCFVQNYFDVDPGPDYHDYQCGHLSYDGHTGTDFRVSTEMMANGVIVRAVADGTVIALRDGETDGAYLRGGPEAVADREAGNGVLVDHGGGWMTQYNHLKRGSVMVHEGDTVHAGDPLGLVGLSGRTEFPHLELVVRVDSEPICPFAGLDTVGCGVSRPLWSARAMEAMGYRGCGLIGAGFAQGPITMEEALDNPPSLAAFSTDAPAMVYWAVCFGVRAGDVMHVRITAPGGREIVNHSDPVESNRAQNLVFAGRRRPDNGWPAGRYDATFNLLRDSGDGLEPLLTQTATITVVP